MKNLKHLRYLIILPVAALLLLLPSFVNHTSAASSAEHPPILSVDGRGTGTVKPDMAKLTIGITSFAKDAAKAQSDNAQTANAIQNSLRNLGIEEKDMKTVNYSFYPTYQTDQNHRNEINGYKADNTLSVTVRNIDLTGKVIDAALSSGANKINDLEFTVADKQSVKKEALQNAIRDARGKAEIIAQGLGKRIVGIQNVSESTDELEGRRFYSFAKIAAADNASGSTPVQPGDLKATANVHIDYIIGD